MTTENNDPKEERSDENTIEHDLAKGNQHTEQNKDDDQLVHTVTPDNDSGIPGPPAEEKAKDE